MNRIGPNPAQVGPLPAEVRAPTPALADLHRGPWGWCLTRTNSPRGSGVLRWRRPIWGKTRIAELRWASGDESGCDSLRITWCNRPGPQFIEEQSGGHEFEEDARRSEEEEEYWRNGFVPSTVAVIPAINGESLRLTAMRWRYSGTWHKAGRRLSSVNLSATAAEHEGYGGESPELSPGAWFLLGGLIGSSSTWITTAVARITAKIGRRRWGQPRWWSDPVQTLYHGKWYSVDWQSKLELDFLSNFHGNLSEVLQQSCCSLYHLHLCYSSHGQILTRLVINCFQRWSNVSVSLIFRLNPPDSQSLGMIISHFLTRTWPALLSKLVVL
jgi:hypothetical protein